MSGEEVEEYEALNTEYFTVNVYDIPKIVIFIEKNLDESSPGKKLPEGFEYQ